MHAPDSGPQMWMPMESSAMSKWRWVDWLRFFFYRFAISVYDAETCNFHFVCSVTQPW